MIPSLAKRMDAKESSTEFREICSFITDFYSEETVNNQGLECLRFLNEVISDFDAVCIKHL